MKITARNSAAMSMACLALAITPAMLVAAESIHPDSVIPAARGSDAPNWELGTVFQATVPGTITHVRVFSLAEESGNHAVRIWRNSDNTMIAGPIDWNFGGNEAWITLDIPDVAIEGNTAYTVAISTSGGWYPANGGYFQSPGGNGAHLIYPQAAGVFSTSASLRPTESFNNASYLRDIVFVPDDLSGPVIKVIGNGADIGDGAITASVINGTELGGKRVDGGTREQTYIIRNIGVQDLNLTNDPIVTVGGAHAADFVVTAQPAAAVLAGGETMFTVRFDPSAIGPRNATLTIAHADSPANPYDFAIRGTGLGGGAGVLGNDGEGAFARNIDDAQIHGNRFLAPVDMRLTELRAKVLELAGTFKCAVYSDSNGVADRLLQSSVGVVNATNGWNTFPLVSPLDVTGGDYYWLVIWADTIGASVQADIAGTYALGSYSYAGLAGQWPDPISLTPGVGGAAVRTYCIYGEGEPLGAAPGAEMDLRGNGKLIVSGDSTPSPLDGTDFGNVDAAVGVREQIFTIQNPGDAPLDLPATPRVSITGPAAGDFIVILPPDSPVAAAGSVSFTVRFDPSMTGLRAATLSIANSDADESPYTVALQGNGFSTGRESIWPDTKTGRDIDFDGAYYELGMKLKPSVPGKVTHLRVYALASEAGDHTARLWRNSDETVIGGPYVWNYGGVTGWIHLDIDDVEVEADTEYTVSVSTGTSPRRNYPNVAADVSNGGNNGQHLSYPTNAGVFTETRDARPTSSFNGGNYLRDIVFSTNLNAGDITYGFEDVTEDFFAIDGIHKGINFGNTKWQGFLTLAGLNQSGAFSASPGAFTLPSGKVLKSIRLSSTSAGDWTINDGANPARSGTLDGTGTPVFLRTEWQAAATNVAIEFFGFAGDLFIDDITYGDPPSVIPFLLIVRADPVTRNVTLRWTGGGDRFQVLKATSVAGPYQPVSGLLFVTEFTDVGALDGGTQAFYRVRNW